MPGSITISPERPDQIEVVALLDALDVYLRALYPPEANHILDVQALLAPDVGFHVARRDGQVLGTGAFRRQPGGPDTDGLPYGEIKRMYVVPAARGQRIAERLLQSLEDALRAEGRAFALLETGPDQREALRLYERCGYTRRGPFGGYDDHALSLFYGKKL